MANSPIASLCLVLATSSLAPAIASAQPADVAAELRAVKSELEESRRRNAALEARLATLERLVDTERSARAEADVRDAGHAEAVQAAAAQSESVLSDRDLPGSQTAITAPPGPVGRALQAAGSNFELLAAGDAAKVSIRLTQEIARTDFNGSIEGPATVTRASLSLSAPTNKKDPRSDVFTSDGFSSDFEARLGLNWYKRTLRLPTYEPALAMVADARAFCNTRAEKISDAKHKEAAVKECASTTISGTWIRQAYGGALGVAKEREYLGLLFPPGGAAYGIEGRAGYKRHEFVDLTALKLEDDTLTPWGVRAYYGVLPKPLQSFTGSVEYAEGKKDAKAGVVCPPGTGSNVTCVSGALGPPKKEERLTLAFEYRELFPLPQDWLLKGVGVAAQVAHDVKNDRTVVDLPIYLVPDAKQNFTGGVRLGWNSEDHDIVAGVFVSSAFGTRPQ
jgi:hypothetical protein